jgi:hypothetical protein
MIRAQYEEIQGSDSMCHPFRASAQDETHGQLHTQSLYPPKNGPQNS